MCSLTRNWTCAHSSGSMESERLDCQGSPLIVAIVLDEPMDIHWKCYQISLGSARPSARSEANLPIQGCDEEKCSV